MQSIVNDTVLVDFCIPSHRREQTKKKQLFDAMCKVEKVKRKHGRTRERRQKKPSVSYKTISHAYIRTRYLLAKRLERENG